MLEWGITHDGGCPMTQQTTFHDAARLAVGPVSGAASGVCAVRLDHPMIHDVGTDLDQFIGVCTT